MIEFPKIGEGVETELDENMVFSMHPHAIADNGTDCLYMQDTWLVTKDGGESLAGLPMRIFDGSESRDACAGPEARSRVHRLSLFSKPRCACAAGGSGVRPRP
jgi:hypothetical protein